jgi:hypothetical protein
MNQAVWFLILLLVGLDLFVAAQMLRHGLRSEPPGGGGLLIVVALSLLGLVAPFLVFFFPALGIEPTLSFNFLVALPLLLVTALAYLPFRQRAVVPPPAPGQGPGDHYADALRQSAVTALLVAGGVLAAHFRGWEVPPLLGLAALGYAAYVLYGVVVIWAAAPGAGWETTPFDDLVLGGDSTGPAPEGQFDVFLSYKSEDVELVRQVADALIAAGRTVWFAEYLILLVDREKFQDAIDDGIRRSRFGVLFTSDRYVASEHCRNELEQLLPPRPGKVLEVRVRDEPGTHERYPMLGDCPALTYRGDVGEVLRFIQEQTALPGEVLPPPEPEATVPAVFQDAAAGYSVEVSGWELCSRGGAAYLGQWIGPQFRRQCDGFRAAWNLVIGSPVVAPRRFREGEPIDDRECFDVTVEFARRYLAARPGAKCVGVHLFFLAGLSHFVVAYWEGGLWRRRYSVILTDPEGVSTEFAFAFGFRGPFTAYCRHVPLMDRVVRSLQRW